MAVYHKKLYIKDTKGVVQNVPIYTTKEECNNICITINDGNSKLYIPYAESKSSFPLYFKKQGRIYNLGAKQDTEYRMSKLYPSTYQTMTSVDSIKDDLQRRIDSNVSLSKMFTACYELINIPFFYTQNVTAMDWMFEYCKKLKSVPLFDTQNVINMSWMFFCCFDLTTVPLFNTQNVTHMTQMFFYCSSLISIPIFDIRNVQHIYQMLYGTKITEVTFRNKPENLQITSEILCGDPNQIKRINFI